MASYLVTGGAGFIGSNIVEKLVGDGHKVRVLDNFSTGRRENIDDFKEVELAEGDVRDLAFVRRVVSGVDYVFHQGALPSVIRSIEDPISTNEVNIDGTLNVLVASRDAGVRRVIYASSSSVYGDTPTLPKTEEMKPNPKSPYAASKLAGEYYCQVFYSVYGLETVSLRYFNIFGPRQDPTSQYAAVIPLFIEAMLNGDTPTIFGDGLQSRDFTFVDNVVKANLLAATAKDAPGKIFNTACGDRHSLLDLVDLLNSIMGKQIKPIHADSRPGDVKHSLAGISEAEKILNYQPQVQFEEGLKKTMAWYQRGKHS